MNKWHIISAASVISGVIILKKMKKTSPNVEEKNLQAFLSMIRWAEGTSGVDGYRTLFGGGLFTSFFDHPRIRFVFTQTNGIKNYTTAAGAYQFIASTWDWVKNTIGLSDFSPASQDRAAIYLLKYRGALDYVKAGNFELALKKASSEWASLSYSTAPQPHKTFVDLQNKYLSYGGKIFK